MSKHVRILGIRGIPAAHGGFETFAERLALYLVEEGWDVTVYCQEDGKGPVIEDEWNGIRRIRMKVAQQGSLGTMIFDWKSILHAARSKDVCLTLGYNTALFNGVLRLKGIPNVINMDGIEWRRAKWGALAKAWFWLNERAGCWLGNHLIADHPEIARHLRERSPARRKITMIPYGGAVSAEGDAGLARLGLTAGKYLTVIARPEPENSILEIVSAFSRKTRGVHLAVLGNYDARNAYCRSVLESASAEVKFLGAIYEQSTVQALRRHCIAYLHGHQVGGTNPSLVEALAAGNAVLAHDNRFNRWVAGPTARFFGGLDECDEQITQVLTSNEWQVESRAGSQARFEASFTWPVVLQRYASLLERYAEQDVRVPKSNVAKAAPGLGANARPQAGDHRSRGTQPAFEGEFESAVNGVGDNISHVSGAHVLSRKKHLAAVQVEDGES